SYNSRTDIFLKHVYESVQEMNICKDKGAGIPKNLAPTVRNKSFEGLQTIVQRLKTYRDKLVVFPRHAGKFKNYSQEAACEF
ncbi:hypothetical protein MKW92_020960, partial [Papaver armeniacum]